MSGIRTRSAYKTLISTNIASGGADISALELREVQNSGADSLAFKGDVEVRVLSMALTAPPGSETDQDAYVPAATATGAWAGKEGQIAIWDAGLSPAAYVFVVPVDGQAVWNIANDSQYRWNTGLSPSVWTQQSGTSGLVFQETVSASADVNVDLPLTTANAVAYEIIMACKVSTDGNADQLALGVTDDGFSTIEADASDYAWNDIEFGTNTFGNVTDEAHTHFRIHLNIGAASIEQIGGKIHINMPHNASFKTGFDIQCEHDTAEAAITTVRTGGWYAIESDINGIRIFVTPTTGSPTITGDFHIFAKVAV